MKRASGSGVAVGTGVSVGAGVWVGAWVAVAVGAGTVGCAAGDVPTGATVGDSGAAAHADTIAASAMQLKRDRAKCMRFIIRHPSMA